MGDLFRPADERAEHEETDQRQGRQGSHGVGLSRLKTNDPNGNHMRSRPTGQGDTATVAIHGRRPPSVIIGSMEPILQPDSLTLGTDT